MWGTVLGLRTSTWAGNVSFGDNIVWGTADWADNIVWGTGLVGFFDGDNIVWGTFEQRQHRLGHVARHHRTFSEVGCDPHDYDRRHDERRHRRLT